jgi:membrane protein DedA with SNARE-associated domain
VFRSIVDFVAGLPPAGIYLAVALLAALENIFPPVPADTAAALGGFLASRHLGLNVWLVYAVTVIGNVGSALGVYVFARKVGKNVLESKIGRRILTPELVNKVQNEFERHHTLGIFLSRCLPVYRAVVPAVAGMMEIPARRVVPAIAAASALFYGAVVWLAYTLGRNWAHVQGMVSTLGLVLLLLALAATLAIVILVLRWKRRRRA